jgi:hypothetical protein
MDRLNWFEKGYAKEALHLGIISPTVFEQYPQYKMYLAFLETDKPTVARKKAAQSCKVSPITIWRVVRFFEKSPVVSL